MNARSKLLRKYERERHSNRDRLVTLPLPAETATVKDDETGEIYENWPKPIVTRVPSKWQVLADGKWQPLDPNCVSVFLRLTVPSDPFIIQCQWCGHEFPEADQCPKCRGTNKGYFGSIEQAKRIICECCGYPIYRGFQNNNGVVCAFCHYHCGYEVRLSGNHRVRRHSEALGGLEGVTSTGLVNPKLLPPLIFPPKDAPETPKDEDWDFPPIPFHNGTEGAKAQFSLEKNAWSAHTDSGKFLLQDGDWLNVLKGLEQRGYQCQVKLCGHDDSHLKE